MSRVACCVALLLLGTGCELATGVLPGSVATPSPVAPPALVAGAGTATATATGAPTVTATATGTVAPSPTVTPSPVRSPSPSPAAVASPSPMAVASPGPAVEPTPVHLEAARAEGKLVYYTTETINEVEGLLRAFRERYPGIAVESWRGDTASLVERLTADLASGRPAADVVVLPAGIDPRPLIERGLFAAYESPQLSAFPAEATAGLPTGMLSPVALDVRAFAYSTRRFPDGGPAEWWALADPRWRGRIGLLDPRGAGAEWLLGMRSILGDGWSGWIDRLAANEPRVYPSYGAMQLALASGEIWLMAPAIPGQVETARLQGAEIDWARPAEPLPAMPAWLVVAAEAPHPAAARLFVDFLLSQSGQRLLAAQGRVPARSDVAAPYLNGARLRLLTSLTPSPDDADLRHLLERFP